MRRTEDYLWTRSSPLPGFRPVHPAPWRIACWSQSFFFPSSLLATRKVLSPLSSHSLPRLCDTGNSTQITHTPRGPSKGIRPRENGRWIQGCVAQLHFLLPDATDVFSPFVAHLYSPCCPICWQKKKEAGLVARSSQYVAWKLNKFNLKRAVTKGIRFPDLNGKWEMEKERFPHEQHVLGMHATRPDPLTCPSEFPFESLFPLHSQLPLESTRNALN